MAVNVRENSRHSVHEYAHEYIEVQMRTYTSTVRIKRRKPTTAANGKLAVELRKVMRNRRTRKGERLAALDRLNQIAPPMPTPESTLGKQ
jgi:hypothetical protein